MVEQDKLSAQVAVLGSLLIKPEFIGEALTKIREEDFTSPHCRMVFCAIRSLFTESGKVDAALVRAKLGGNDGVDWGRFLLETMEITPTAYNIWEYAAIMREQARMTKVIELAGLLQVAGDSGQARQIIARLQETMVDRHGVKRMNMEEALISFGERHTTVHQYMTWGIPTVDKKLFVDLEDMVVLGGYPSAGKTALAVSFAFHQAKEKRVGFYSLETSRYKLADRLISNMAGIEMGEIKRSEISEQSWQRLADCSDRIRQRKLDLIEASGMTAQDIQADALAKRYEVIYIDYLQLVEPESRRINRTEQVSGISRSLQQLAHKNGLLVVALSQLARMEKTRDEKMIEPTMSDLRESGQIEQDADAILLLYLEDLTRPSDSRRILKVAKNKEGKRGKIYLDFDGSYQRFKESDEPKGEGGNAPNHTSMQVTFQDLPASTPVPF